MAADPNRIPVGQAFRKHVRIEVRLETSFVVEGDETGEKFQAYTKNIGLGGVCVQAYERKDRILQVLRGDHAEVRASLSLLDDEKTIDVSARTAWINARVGWIATLSQPEAPLLMGLSFVDLTEADAETISTFIADAIVKNRESIVEVEKRILSEIKGSPD